MAVEIPVVIDIDAAFKEAAGRVKTSMKPLEAVINSAPMSLFIDVKIGRSKKLLIELFDEPRTTLAQFQSALDQVNARINKMAAKGGFNLLGSGLKAEEKELLEAASLLETKIKGVGNASSTMGNVLTLNMQRAEAEITKYTAKLDQLQRKQNLSGKVTGGLDPRVNMSKYQKQIDNVNIKLKETRTFLAACSIELDRMGIKARQVGVAVDLSNKAAIEMAAGFRRGHEALLRWNAGLAQSNSHLLAMIKGAAALFSLHAATRFIQNVRNVTAEFEMQRVALGGIIQDTERAEKLFKQIKAAAIKSPFEIKDLVSYTKQLSAYRIETENLFDVTMRLADISAGLGVDMSRLVLAYGQVRAAAVLRGQELRQFTEAGIPLVDLLAEKFSELNGRTVKTAEVFDLISKRAVPFSMIKEIFEDMTNAGGVFYKMQEKQSETLKGQWMKLKDAASIMYDEIGNTGTVHKAMTDLLAMSMRLMQNWRETGNVLKGLVASIVAYKIVVANARVAANALTAAEVAEISALELNTVSRSKLIAAIFGETAATKLSITLGNAYVAVKTREMMATNLFTKALYRMLAAMLKNPYALAAAGIAVLIAALVKLAKKADESRISIDEFQKSVEGFNEASSHADDVDKLCDKYDQLANKADRTKKETDDLVRVTKELGRAYPQAITGTDAQTGALILNTKAIRENNEEAREAIRLSMEQDKQRAESSMADLVEERNRIIAQLQRGTKLQYVQSDSGMYGAIGTYQEIKFSDKDRAKFGERLIELAKQIGEFEEAIDAADKALLGLSDDLIGPPLPDFFDDAWRSQLNRYTTTLESTNTKVKALTKNQIEGFGDQRVALQAVADEYEAQTALVEFYTKAMAKATGDRRSQTEKSLADAKLMQAMYRKILEDFNALSLVKDKGGKGYTADPFIQMMNDRMKFMKDFKKGYEDLQKYMGQAGALGEESKIMKSRGLSLGLSETEQKRAAEELSQWYQDAIDEAFSQAQRYGAAGTVEDFLAQQISGSTNRAKALRDFQKLIQSLWDAQTDLDTSTMVKNFEKSFKKMKEDLKRSSEVKKFYDDILDMTGDTELTQTLTFSVYGNTEAMDFTQRIQQELSRAMASLDEGQLTDELREAIQKQDFGVILANIEKFSRAWQEEIKQMASDSEAFHIEEINRWLKDLEEVKTFGQRRVQLSRETAKQIALIQASKLPEETKKTMIEGYRTRELKETKKLQYEAFKDSKMYISVFENMDTVSSRMLKNMRARLVALKGEWKDLDPVQIKELQKRIEEIDQQIADRNPFKAYIDGFKAYSALVRQGRSRSEDEKKASDAEAARKVAETNLESAIAASKEAEAKGEVSDELKQQVSAAQEAYDLAAKNADAAQKNADEWNKVAQAITNAAAQLSKYADYTESILSATRGVLDAFASEDTIEWFDIASNTLSKVLDGGIKTASGVAKIISGTDVVGGVVDTVSGLAGLVAGVWGGVTASKIKKANEDIEDQEKIVNSLEKAYDRLEEAMSKSFGSDYIYNFNQQATVLRAKIDAYNKMIDAERGKGKKADEKKIEEWQEKIEEAEKTLGDMRGKLAEFFAGTDLASAAKDFATSWIDAYKEFGSTTDAIKGKFQDMIQNMITQSLAAKLIQTILDPVFQAIDTMAGDGELTASEIADISDMTLGATEDIDRALSVLMSKLAAAGYNIRQSDSQFTGISRNIATATEESINGLAAGINTQNFYMSYVPTISQDVAAIRTALVGTSAVPEAVTPSQFGDEMFRGQMSRIDENIAEIRGMLKSVITPKSASVNTHCVGMK